MVKPDLFLNKVCSLQTAEDHTMYNGTCGAILQNKEKHPALVSYPYCMEVNTSMNGNKTTIKVLLTGDLTEDLEEARKPILVKYFVKTLVDGNINYIIDEGRLKISK